MGAADLLTALNEYVTGVVVDCGQPEPTRIFRYHGAAGMPEDCCTDDGYLVASWDTAYPTDTFPNSSATRGTPCPGYPVFLVALRYVICWPIPDVGPQGVRTIDASWDTRAERLARVSECVSRALIRLSCTDPGNQLHTDVLVETHCNAFKFRDATPIDPTGGCAGVVWRAFAGIRGGDTPS